MTDILPTMRRPLVTPEPEKSDTKCQQKSAFHDFWRWVFSSGSIYMILRLMVYVHLGLELHTYATVMHQTVLVRRLLSFCQIYPMLG